VFVPGKPFQPNQLFADKVWSLPKQSTFLPLLEQAPGLTLKYYTRLKRLTALAHFSLSSLMLRTNKPVFVPVANLL
jgi:hypothetical protein